jgi:hypothetical protein
MTGDLFPLPAEEVVANLAAKRMAELHKEIDRLRGNMRELLKHAGIVTVCQGPRCGKSITMIRHHDTGRMTPYNFDGTNHFITCVDAPLFKTAKGVTNAR